MFPRIKPYKTIALILLSITTFMPHSYAETIVHLERTKHKLPAYVPPQSSPPATSENIKTSNVSPVADTPNKDNASTTHPAIDTKDTADSNSPKEIPSSSEPIDNNKTTNNFSDNADKDIYANTYFSNFKLFGPKTRTYFGDAGDIAGLSSIITFGSYFYLISPDEQEKVTVTLFKKRLAWAFGADVEYWFWVEYDLDCQPIVSNKKKPKFEFNKNGNITEHEIKSLEQVGSNKFLLIFSDKKKITDIIESNARISVLLPILSGEYLRIPIPPKAIAQWQEVVDTDLKALKKKYDKDQ